MTAPSEPRNVNPEDEQTVTDPDGTIRMINVPNTGGKGGTAPVPEAQ